jgi:hypothetical protein
MEFLHRIRSDLRYEGVLHPLRFLKPPHKYYPAYSSLEVQGKRQNKLGKLKKTNIPNVYVPLEDFGAQFASS